MQKLISRLAVGIATFTPALALAQFSGSNDLTGLANNIISFINNTLIPLVFAVALLVFIWGMFKFFIMGGHDEDAKEKGKSLMVWAVVGFVLMVSIFGVVNLIANGLGFSGQDLNNIPSAPTRG